MDSIHVLTASDVPPQARACNALTLALLLTAAFRKVVGKNLPGELAEFILAETNGIDFGLSREQAEERRRALMADRRVQGVKVNDVSMLASCQYPLFDETRGRFGRRVIRCASIDVYKILDQSHCIRLAIINHQ
jgi:hypothetical protein